MTLSTQSKKQSVNQIAPKCVVLMSLFYGYSLLAIIAIENMKEATFQNARGVRATRVVRMITCSCGRRGPGGRT